MAFIWIVIGALLLASGAKSGGMIRFVLGIVILTIGILALFG